ncbi:MAG: hypothetical protein K0R55_4269 [Sporomusa sp.]|jgi:hypothetical protein|nr:hypothetical protein [Sporomusa sp.]
MQDCNSLTDARTRHEFDKAQESYRAKYILYEWLGKVKWCYLCGIYLVDPKYEGDFIKEHRVH